MTTTIVRAKTSVEWVDRADRIPADFWDICYPTPIEGRWWYEALEQAGLETQFRFLYGLVRRNDDLLAIAPVFLMNVPMELVVPGWFMPCLRILASFDSRFLHQPTIFVGSACSDEGTVGLAPGVKLEEVLSVIHAAVETKAREKDMQMIVWKDFPALDFSSLSKLCDEHDYFAMASYPGTILELADAKVESYWNGLKGSRRHNLKKKLKRSKEKIDLSVEIRQSPDEETLEEIWGLFWQTYQKGKTKFEQLTPKFFRAIASKDVSWFVLLRDAETNRLVAFMLCFQLGKRVINKFIGIDYDRPSDCYLYFRLWEAALKWVLETGACEFQSGQTGYRAKIDVGHSLVPLLNFCKHRNPLLHELYRRVGSTTNWSELDSDLAAYLVAHPAAEFRLTNNRRASVKEKCGSFDDQGYQ